MRTQNWGSIAPPPTKVATMPPAPPANQNPGQATSPLKAGQRGSTRCTSIGVDALLCSFSDIGLQPVLGLRPMPPIVWSPSTGHRKPASRCPSAPDPHSWRSEHWSSPVPAHVRLQHHDRHMTVISSVVRANGWRDRNRLGPLRRGRCGVTRMRVGITPWVQVHGDGKAGMVPCIFSRCIAHGGCSWSSLFSPEKTPHGGSPGPTGPTAPGWSARRVVPVTGRPRLDLRLLLSSPSADGLLRQMRSGGRLCILFFLRASCRGRIGWSGGTFASAI